MRGAPAAAAPAVEDAAPARAPSIKVLAQPAAAKSKTTRKTKADVAVPAAAKPRAAKAASKSKKKR